MLRLISTHFQSQIKQYGVLKMSGINCKAVLAVGDTYEADKEAGVIWSPEGVAPSDISLKNTRLTLQNWRVFRVRAHVSALEVLGFAHGEFWGFFLYKLRLFSCSFKSYR